MQTNGSDGKQVVMLKWSQLIVTLAVWLVSLGTIYGTMQTKVDEAQRATQELKDKKVDQRQFDEMRDDLIRRLDRIESKVDRERAQRENR
jgi:hypothetical protein